MTDWQMKESKYTKLYEDEMLGGGTRSDTASAARIASYTYSLVPDIYSILSAVIPQLETKVHNGHIEEHKVSHELSTLKTAALMCDFINNVIVTEGLD